MRPVNSLVVINRSFIRNSRRDIVEAIGPVMGESIRVQIREERKDMIEALYPIIWYKRRPIVGEDFDKLILCTNAARHRLCAIKMLSFSY